MDWRDTYNGFIVNHVNIAENAGKSELCEEARAKEALGFDIILCKMLKMFLRPWVTEETPTIDAWAYVVKVSFLLIPLLLGFTCDWCEDVFMTPGMLYTHKEGMHQPRTGPWC